MEKKQNEAIQREIEEMNATDEESETEAPNNAEEADPEESDTSMIDAEILLNIEGVTLEIHDKNY